jgi:beta-glucanase (GH16 family)
LRERPFSNQSIPHSITLGDSVAILSVLSLSLFLLSHIRFPQLTTPYGKHLTPYHSAFCNHLAAFARAIMLCKVTAFVAAGLTLTQAAPPAIPGFSLTWSDDFEGSTDSLPSPANWIIDTGAGYAGGPNHWGTGEIQNYTANPANLNLTGDSVLRITPLRDGNNQWTSARIESQRSDFQAMAGGKMRISARIKMPNVTGDAAAGYWPAFWSLGDKGRGKYQDWPMVGEYDIMEVSFTRSSDVGMGLMRR